MDMTPKSAGLYFDIAPNGTDILLREAQVKIQDGDSDGSHLASSMYSNGTKRSGFNLCMTPLAHDEKEDKFLLDMTDWLFSFGRTFTKLVTDEIVESMLISPSQIVLRSYLRVGDVRCDDFWYVYALDETGFFQHSKLLRLQVCQACFQLKGVRC